MIRIGFSLAFPESCSKLNPEEERDPEIVAGEVITENQETDLPSEPSDVLAISNDQKRIIDELYIAVPEVPLPKCDTYEDAEKAIFLLKEAIFHKIMKSKTPCTDSYLSMVFGWDNVVIQGMYNQLKKSFKARASLD